ncbi:conserved hypothetical protein [Flavobacterium psychrophilum]|uniref:DUF2752 domain-containing protein n=1 Tax=Flavobacterium psychrophilum TaxID=96345 RepID=UPI000B7C2849|nr:DUF2752 domain-containing protein [Flavobacterium psychrophilum]GEJ30231.1 hypothetical protein FPN184_contig00004-0062 [Flavobacterium psychrophilum]GEJ49524.1 hypothetical protein FPKKA176_contig00031-0024 [Flavobacterium psychrophilum]SNB19848.1 conserved hypothetical protein [Flavobacterium psychrophilum]SNB22458.1 conserved hypothetical protein [Flavobacterium psychrophilum]
MKIEEFMIPCLSKMLFGVDCLGCGTQRALILVLKGKFTEAFYMFPAIYTTILFFIILGLNFFNKSKNYNKLIILLAIINAVIMIISYIYKLN